MNIPVPNSTLTIAIVSNATSGGGAEKSMMALHEEFLRAGLKSNFVALNKNLPINGVPKVTILNRRWKSGVRATVNNYFEFKKTIRSINPQILILNCELPELFGSLINFNGQIICVEHTTKPWIGKRSLGRIVRTLLHLKKCVWVSVIKDQEEVWFGGPVTSYIPNPFVLPDSHHKEQASKAMLSYVGGLKVNKRPEWVIKAGIELGLSVNIFGEGLLRKRLEDQYRNYSNQIKFYGFYSNPWGLISRNSLVIVPSQYEGDGMVVMEAILSGIPLVLADNEDMRRFNLDNKHYFNSYERLIAIIENNIKSKFKDLLVSRKVSNVLIHERSLKNVTDRWVNVLAALTNNTPTV